MADGAEVVLRLDMLKPIEDVIENHFRGTNKFIFQSSAAGQRIERFEQYNVLCTKVVSLRELDTLRGPITSCNYHGTKCFYQANQ